MSEKTSSTTVTQPTERDLVMSRVFDAPQEMVFKAFSNCAALMQWWGPRLWPTKFCEIDFRPGGVWRYCMRGPAGEEAWGKATYRDIVSPERIAFVDAFTDADGNETPGMAQAQVVVEFAEYDGKTRLTTRATYASPADLKSVLDMGMVDGMTETWDRLEEFLAKHA